MGQQDIALIAHLLRRAGFGASRLELEDYAAKGYEETVEELLHPELAGGPQHEDIEQRYHVSQTNFYPVTSCQMYWLRRMINSRRPLEEKIALFWHGVFATGFTKLFQARSVLQQIDIFRRFGFGKFNTLLDQISRDPSMIFWLDNKDNHRVAVNENYGRELLELFSMGVGNYTEDDVRQASRTFTGWTIGDAGYHSAKAERCSAWPYGDLAPHFEHQGGDHDEREKRFLGDTGNFNGEDITEIICHQPATARFIARHLYTFFVADETQVPTWNKIPPGDPAAIETIVGTYFSSDYDIRSVLRVIFNSDFFKNAVYAKVKSPTELVVGTARLAGGYDFPRFDDINLATETTFMGQSLLDPPSVEGWHSGEEWINTAFLMNRVNFAASQLSDGDRPGVRSIIDSVVDRGVYDSPEDIVDACLDLLGISDLAEEAIHDLVANAAVTLESHSGDASEPAGIAERVRAVLRLIPAMPEYQMA
ncbi:DUF1800 domain-containing protein [Dehalococcoidia bacterium]|jgi:uncharacterized protein (DUF1800 family)|nr:DUF1800 domain-containing protein [Dehalococcoidia bacterium]